jgi:hypothetical protein
LYGKREKQGESWFFINEVRNRDYKTVIRNDKPPINGIKCNLESLRSNRINFGVKILAAQVTECYL